MTNDRITQLEARIKELESYLNQFESYRKFNQTTKPTIPTVPTKSKRGSRLQEDWQPSSTLLTWTAKEFPSVDVALETDKFIDYWLSRAGAGAVKIDWDRTYRNWIRNASQFYKGKHETHKRIDKPDYNSAVRNCFD